MTARRFSRFAAAVFAIVAVLHLARAALGWAVTIGPYDVPLWMSWIGFVVAGALARTGFGAARD